MSSEVKPDDCCTVDDEFGIAVCDNLFHCEHPQLSAGVCDTCGFQAQAGGGRGRLRRLLREAADHIDVYGHQGHRQNCLGCDLVYRIRTELRHGEGDD